MNCYAEGKRQKSENAPESNAALMLTVLGRETGTSEEGDGEDASPDGSTIGSAIDTTNGGRGNQTTSTTTKEEEELSAEVVPITASDDETVFEVESCRRKAGPQPIPFSQFFRALCLYKDLYNSGMSVIEGWRVPPKAPWPKSCWNTYLGDVINDLRSGKAQLKSGEREKLDNIGFIWNYISECERVILLAFQAYKKKFGDLNIPRKFVIPENSADFPVVTWGLRLGSKVKDIRGHGGFKNLHEELKKLGFGFERHHERQDHTFDDFYETVSVYKQMYGNLVVSNRWKVPAMAPWPEATWGLDLCSKLRSLRGGRLVLTQEQKLKLNELGFVWNPMDEKDKVVMMGLKAYKAVYGHFNVPKGFVVPEHSPDFPEVTWLMPLGERTKSILNKGGYKGLHDELRELGFPFKPTFGSAPKKKPKADDSAAAAASSSNPSAAGAGI